MPSIPALHPQVVHFVIALAFLGIILRILSLLGKGAWLNPAAALLIILAAGASVVAVKSGTDAHGIAERIPGAREAVQKHEDLGKDARTILLILGGAELIGLLFGSRPPARVIRALTAVGGLYAGYVLYEAAEHGGDLVYNYAGGIGTRSGNPEDLKHLLVAGLYHNARVARDSGRADEAARLTDMLAQVQPNDPTITFLVAESQLKDRKDPAAALATLGAMQVPADDPRLAPRHGILTAQALAASGQADSARALLTALAAKFPQSRAIQAARDQLK